MSSWLVPLVILNVTAGLALEAYGAGRGWHWAELTVGALTAAHFAYHLARPPVIAGTRIGRDTLLWCLGLATAGELVLSAVWELYTYRASVLPLFVPPGHVLLFLAGLSISHYERCARSVAILVPAAAAAPLIYAVTNGTDFLSVPLFAIFLACLALGRDPKLYAVMFVLALGLELYGTALGAWSWAEDVRGLGLPSANPPLAAGVFYAVLDLLTVRLTRKAQPAASRA
ncbi:MAG TPA: hypothetical protein VFV50_10630 [Bdellovibrionales bacterium]|nr:hypothetical protein [Bdellovibrionales bacterium]